MWRSVIDTKQGKVWANHPKDQRMMVVADVEEDANKYWMWNKLVRAIREADEINIEVFGKLIEKNFKKTVDSNVNLGHTIKSDRGNPTDL